MPISPATVTAQRPLWTNRLPDGWRFTRFGDVLRRVKRPKQILDDVEYVQPVLRRRHGGVAARGRQWGRDIKTKTQFELKADDWLMSRVQILHAAHGVVPAEMEGSVASASYLAFRARPNLHLRYFWYLSHLFQFHRTCAISSVGVVSEKMVFRVGDWEDLEFPLPPLAEQRKIAAILSSVDEAIQAKTAVLEQARKVKQGLLQDLLRRGLGHRRFRQTEIGEIPESWSVSSVEDLLADTPAAMRSGPFGSALLKSELVEEGIPLLGIDNVQIEEFVPEYRRFVTEEKYEQLRRYAVRPDDVMITIMGTVGRCCLVPEGIGRALSSKHTWTLTFDKTRYRPYLACSQLNHARWVSRHFERDQQGGTMAAIRSETLRTLQLPVPPAEEQVRIETVLRSLDANLATLEQKLEAVRRVKAGLLQDLLTGKVRAAIGEATPS